MEALAAKQVNTAYVYFPALLIMFYSAVQYMNNVDCCKLNASSPGVSLESNVVRMALWDCRLSRPSHQPLRPCFPALSANVLAPVDEAHVNK